METWGKVTTRSQVSVYRNNDPMVTIAAIDLKHYQDGRHTHLGYKKSLCPVTVLVDSQVSDRCPWATCSVLSGRSHRFLGFNQYSRELVCLAQGHNTVTLMGIEPRTSRFGVRRS